MRPHPADDPDTVKDLMFKHGVRSDRVSCIGTNEVFPWISASRLVVHNCCTTSLEAGFLGTPVVTYAPSGIFLLEDDTDGLHQQINKLFPEERYEVTLTGKPLVFQKGTKYLVKNLAISNPCYCSYSNVYGLYV